MTKQICGLCGNTGKYGFRNERCPCQDEPAPMAFPGAVSTPPVFESSGAAQRYGDAFDVLKDMVKGGGAAPVETHTLRKAEEVWFLDAGFPVEGDVTVQWVELDIHENFPQQTFSEQLAASWDEIVENLQRTADAFSDGPEFKTFNRFVQELCDFRDRFQRKLAEFAASSLSNWLLEEMRAGRLPQQAIAGPVTAEPEPLPARPCPGCGCAEGELHRKDCRAFTPRILAKGGSQFCPIGYLAWMTDENVRQDADLSGRIWLPCDGRAVARDAYPELFEFIGHQHGEPPGKSSFRLPKIDAPPSYA